MKKLVLDLDESLVFSTLESTGPNCIELSADGAIFFTRLRPGIREFMEFVKTRFEVTLWSTGQQAYLESVWQHVGVPGIRLWGRSYCKRLDTPTASEPYEKPLEQIEPDLSRILIVDNTPSMFAKYPLNGILIRTWRGDANDAELDHLSRYLDWMSRQKDMQRDHRSWRIETLCLRST